MSTTLTAGRQHRAWQVAVLASAVAILLAIVIATTAYVVTGSGRTDRPAPVPTLAPASRTPTPGNGLPCRIHQPC